MTPSDGAPAYETTDIALVLDPPLAPGDASDQATMVELIANLRSASSNIEAWRGWLFVSETQIRSQSEHAVLLYSRA
jgi:hypothetical protein